jgi:hypothetical protein
VKRGRRLGALLLVLAVSACATAGRGRGRATFAVDPQQAQALLDRVQASGSERRALRGIASLSFDGTAGSVRSRQVIVVEVPSHLRIEVQGFLSQSVAVLVTDGEQFDLFRAEDRSRRSGPVYPGLLSEVAQIDLTPEEGVALVLGVPPEAGSLLLASGVGLDDGGVRLERVDTEGVLRQRIDFDAQGRLARVEVYEPGERLLWSAEYRDHRDVGGIDFAHEIALWFPSSQTQLELVFKQVELNPTLPEGVFTLPPPRPVRAGSAG